MAQIAALVAPSTWPIQDEFCAAVSVPNNTLGFGCIIRDSADNVFGAMIDHIQASFSLLAVELNTMWCELQFCIDIGCHEVILEHP